MDTREGLSVQVQAANRADAERLAYLQANRENPGRQMGPILHVEEEPEGTWEVVIEDLGPVEVVVG